MSGTPVLPSNSGTLGLGVFGYMTLGLDYTPLSDLIETYPDHDYAQIEIYTSAFVMCGVIDDYEAFTYTEKWYDLDTFEIRINRYKTNVSQFSTSGYIRFEDNGFEHVGVIESIEKPLDSEGKATETWKITGRGIAAIFAHYPCMYGTDTGSGFNKTTEALVPTLTFTFAASTTVTASASCLASVAVGHYIYNSTDDSLTAAIKITAISLDGITITLVSAYAGTTGSGKAAIVCGDAWETFSKKCVNVECISTTDAAAVLPGLTNEIDWGRGNIVVRAVRFESLIDVLVGGCRETGDSFKLVHGTGLNFVFTYCRGTDRSATVVITPEYGNVETLNYIESLLEKKNLLYMGGTGTGASRVVRKVYSGTEPTGWSRRARFVDAQDCTTNALLDARGNETLATTGESLTMEVGYLESPSFKLGTHFALGDFITVYFEGVATLISRITSITYEWSADGKRIKLGLGKDAPDFVSIMKLNDKLNKAQGRR